MSLIDVNELKKSCKYDPDREHKKQNREAPGSIQGAIGEHSGGMDKNNALSSDNSMLDAESSKSGKNAYIGAISKPGQSYHTHTSSLAAGGNK